jgi:hypothetical protein
MLVVHESVVSADLEGEAVLLNVETGVYFGLDELGSEIWHLLEQSQTEEAIIQHLMGEYDVSADVLRADLVDFLDVLRDKGLVRLED